MSDCGCGKGDECQDDGVVPPVPVPSSEVLPLYYQGSVHGAITKMSGTVVCAVCMVRWPCPLVREVRRGDTHDPMPRRSVDDCVVMLDSRHWCDRKHHHARPAVHHCPCGLAWCMGKAEPDFSFKDSFNMGAGEP